jgi:hypothetical protein
MTTEKERRVISAIFACGSEDCPKPFALYRDQDITGVSGTGTVAHGVRFADGTTALRWLGDSPSTVIWASLDDAMKIHGHDGKTRLVWLAADFAELAADEERRAMALARHQHQMTDSHGIDLCAGCLELWPCPDLDLAT